MTEGLILLPWPKCLEFKDGECVVDGSFFLLAEPSRKNELYPVFIRLQQTMECLLKHKPPIVLRTGMKIKNTIFFDSCSDLCGEAYELEIMPFGICVKSGEASGAFRAAATLKQLMALYGRKLPCLHIKDSPDFKARGIMLDIGRNKIPTMETLYRIVDFMADLKLNQLQLYMEGFPFSYPSFTQVWKDGTPVTGQEIMELDQYCRDRFIELVPNQNSFGHMSDWLARGEFSDMAECPGGFTTPWSGEERAGTLDPQDPRSLKLVEDMIDDLLPYFSSGLYNAGCDETFELGKGKSSERCADIGVGRVYLEYLLSIHELVKMRGRKMMFWGDIIVNSPELIPELPDDIIALDWGYEASHPFDERGRLYRQSGIEYYVCPGTSSWNSIAGRTDNMKRNLLNAAVQGFKNGAAGYLITDWGDCGHWQYLPVSYPGFSYGAAVSWRADEGGNVDLEGFLDQMVFGDHGRVIGKQLLLLGNYYLKEGKDSCNCSNIFTILRMDVRDMNCIDGISGENLKDVEEHAVLVERELETAVPQCDDAQTILEELKNSIRLIRHGVHLGQLKLKLSKDIPDRAAIKRQLLDLSDEISEIIMRHQELWLARNRAGGLEQSVGRMIKLNAAYTDLLEEFRLGS